MDDAGAVEQHIESAVRRAMRRRQPAYRVAVGHIEGLRPEARHPLGFEPAQGGSIDVGRQHRRSGPRESQRHGAADTLPCRRHQGALVP